ncbi:LIM domain-containing protein [Prevotella sp.]
MSIIVTIVVKRKNYHASCFLERQCSTMFDNRGSDIIYCAHEYYKMIVKHCQYCR